MRTYKGLITDQLTLISRTLTQSYEFLDHVDTEEKEKQVFDIITAVLLDLLTLQGLTS